MTKTLGTLVSKQMNARALSGNLFVGDADTRSYFVLTNRLALALDAGDVETAQTIAHQLLPKMEAFNDHAKSCTSSAYALNAYNVYDALGRAAFQRKDFDEAQKDLLKAASTVTSFLISCQSFWTATN